MLKAPEEFSFDQIFTRQSEGYFSKADCGPHPVFPIPHPTLKIIGFFPLSNTIKMAHQAPPAPALLGILPEPRLTSELRLTQAALHSAPGAFTQTTLLPGKQLLHSSFSPLREHKELVFLLPFKILLSGLITKLA